MLKLIELVRQIVVEGNAVVTAYVDRKDLTGVIDYATIFAHTKEEYSLYLNEVQKNTRIAGELPTGNYYWLDSPIVTPFGTIKRMRIHVFDSSLKKRGYVDFETKNFSDFKKKYLKQPEFSLVDKKDYELVELESPESNVLVYFPFPFE